MASPFSHAVAALSIGTCFKRPQIRKRVWVLVCLSDNAEICSEPDSRTKSLRNSYLRLERKGSKG